MLDQPKLRNRLLTRLTATDFARLAPFLEFMELERDYVLVKPNEPIDHV
jgi:hypothetical protein